MTRVKINSGSGSQVSINNGGAASVTINRVTGAFPIERKTVNSLLATYIVISASGGLAYYQYFDRDGVIIGTGNISMNTDRTIEQVKTDVFTSLTLTDLQVISFTKLTPNTSYVAFGNLIHKTGTDYLWDGRRGATHLGNGRIYNVPYSSLTRTFGTPNVVSRGDGLDLRGGSNCKIDGTLYFFTSLYSPGPNEFISMLLSKSTDGLDGITWAEQTLLYAPGTHGGIDETTYDRFNFYGTPVNVGNKWFIPWFEHDGSVNWRVNYLLSEDNFATWTTNNVSDSQIYENGEPCFVHVGGDTLIILSRPEDNKPLQQNVSFDLGATWEGWEQTNLGSSVGTPMAAALLTDEYGLVVVYADRGTGNIMLSKNNTVATVIATPTSYSTPEILYTTSDTTDGFPLGYPSIIRVAQYRYMISFSEGDGDADLWIGDGSLNLIDD